MKKWTAGLLSVILVMGMTACNKDDNKDANGGAGNTPNAEQPGKGSEAPKDAVPTVDELIQKSAEASKGLKSFSMDSDIKQNIKVNVGETKEETKVDMSMKMDTTTEPMEMYQELDVNMAGEKQHMKQYITQKGVFANVDGQWVEVPEEEAKQFQNSLAATAEAPEKQLEQFKKISKDTKVSEEGDQYILTADVSGDNLKELAKSYMSQTGGNNEQTEMMMEQMNIKSMKVIFGVNKTTYLPTKTDMDMVMEMEQDGQKISLEMAMKSTISKHNEVKKIEVPAEALGSKGDSK